MLFGGNPWRIAIIMSCGLPSTGRDDIRPITGHAGSTLVHHLRHVRFQEPFAIRLKKRDGAIVIEQVGAREAEIDFLTVGAQRHTLQPIGHGAIFGLAERLRVISVDTQHAMRGGGVFVQHLADMLLVRGIGRRGGASARE